MFKQFINKRFDKWLSRRMPATKEITLNSGNTFIFPSKTGIHFLVSCFILFLLGTNYQNNLILFLVFFLCSFMITCLLLSFKNLAGLIIKSVETHAQFAGHDIQFKLRIKHNKHSGQDISYKFQHASSVLHTIVESDSVCLYALNKQRGYFNPGRVTVRSTFPFGLFNVWTHLDFGLQVLLYPKPIENKMSLQRSPSNLHDSSLNQSIAGVDQFSNLKNYQAGESLKSVAWKQVAQGRGWFSKQFEQSAGGDISLDIDTLNHLPLETRLSYICYQIIELERTEQRYALSLYNQNIEVGSGRSHQKRCLTALALVKGKR